MGKVRKDTNDRGPWSLGLANVLPNASVTERDSEGTTQAA